MAFKTATNTGGGFLDLRELAGDGPVLVLFRIREFHGPEKASGFDGVNLPVIADVLICSGPRTGEVHTGERFIGAITSALRGVKNPNKSKGEEPQAPVNEVGDEIATRVKVLNAGKPNAGAVGDEPSAVEVGAIRAVYADGAGWAGRELATAGTGAPAARPWK